MTLQSPLGEGLPLVNLQHWILDTSVLDVLQGSLPHWPGTLYMTDCAWPLKPAQYKRLATAIPTSYKTWCLPEGLSKARLDAICAGVNERREGLGLPRVKLIAPGYSGPVHVGKHVVMSDRLPGETSDNDESVSGESESAGESEGE